ncbi:MULTISPECIES: polysaccharide deacetylase family protein [unclassified Carboxylicivirga]|uniref:polysaccharide deacetylase family protein n=1 Tax=Carboxylicivirga TaxID=1628153 RepID=UPI003D356617
MQSALNTPQLEYVLFHLNRHVNIDELKPYFKYGNAADTSWIQMPASENKIDLARHIPYADKRLPVLFPCSDNSSFFSIEDKKVIFHHDLLKACFYLLSGYQETQCDERDFAGRFPHKESIQNKLNINHLPLVNYYFKIIIEGLKSWGIANDIKVSERNLPHRGYFLLSHDIDRTHYYHWRETAYRWMQVLGLRKATYDKKRLKKAALDSLLPTLFPGYKTDPFWSFKAMRKMEKARGMVSAWYFLNRDGSAHDARYFFKDKAIRDMMLHLHHDGCEIGLHGSLKTAESEIAMHKAMTDLKAAFPATIYGIRQHFLKFKVPESYQIQAGAGLQYDTSVGFAEHEGFRNGYCHPFKPYDFENDRMIDIWEFPLTVMDGTLFYYRKYNYEQASDAMDTLLKEVKQFGGLFSLLWHNSFFDEYEFPGITQFYTSTLKQIADYDLKSVTGKQLLELL